MARVLRFQIATAIPPKAAELASNRLVRQRFGRCDGGTAALDSSVVLKGMGMDNLRRGMDDLLENCMGEGLRGKLFRGTCVYVMQRAEAEGPKDTEIGI